MLSINVKTGEGVEILGKKRKGQFDYKTYSKETQ